MPSAVWQGFYSLLRDHPPLSTRLNACITPTPGGPWAAMAPPWGSPTLPKRPRRATKAAKTNKKGLRASAPDPGREKRGREGGKEDKDGRTPAAA